MTFDLIVIGLAIAFDPIPLATSMIVLSSASCLDLEIYACFWTGQSQASVARFRTWIDSTRW